MSSNPTTQEEEGSPVWVIVLVCLLVLAVAVIIEVVHYSKIYIKERKAKQQQSLPQ